MPIWIGKYSTNLLEEDQGDHDIVISDFSIPSSNAVNHAWLRLLSLSGKCKVKPHFLAGHFFNSKRNRT